MTNIELSLLYDNTLARHCVRGQLLKSSASTIYPEVVKGNIDVYAERLMKVVCDDPAITQAESPFDVDGKLKDGITPALESAANFALTSPAKVVLLQN